MLHHAGDYKKAREYLEYLDDVDLPASGIVYSFYYAELITRECPDTAWCMTRLKAEDQTMCCACYSLRGFGGGGQGHGAESAGAAQGGILGTASFFAFSCASCAEWVMACARVQNLQKWYCDERRDADEEKYGAVRRQGKDGTTLPPTAPARLDAAHCQSCPCAPARVPALGGRVGGPGHGGAGHLQLPAGRPLPHPGRRPGAPHRAAYPSCRGKFHRLYVPQGQTD
jgi:hypothetical protein